MASATVLISLITVAYSPSYSWIASVRDHDGDGTPDSRDAFAYDPLEWRDADADGYGDNSDEFPDDPAEHADSDDDGSGDNSDAFPLDSEETVDSDGDGCGDNADLFDGGNLSLRISIDEFWQLTKEEFEIPYFDEWGDIYWTHYSLYSNVNFTISCDVDQDGAYEILATSETFERPGHLASPLSIEVDISESCSLVGFRAQVFLTSYFGPTIQADCNSSDGRWTTHTIAYPYPNLEWSQDGREDGLPDEYDCRLDYSITLMVN